MDEKEVEFLSIHVNQPLLSAKSIRTRSYSRDGGKSFQVETNQYLLETFYFLQGDVDEFTYESYNFINVASDLGGLAEILFILFSLFPFYYYNPKVTQRKFIEKLYFVEKD